MEASNHIVMLTLATTHYVNYNTDTNFSNTTQSGQ